MDNQHVIQGMEEKEAHMQAPPTCSRCNKYIYDGTILKVKGQLWHNACLTCTVCRQQVSNLCHVHNQQVYCRSDFIRLFGAKCAGCHKVVSTAEAGHVVEGSVYHVTCFSCISCRRQLQAGDSFYVKDDGKLLCYHDYKQITCSDDSSPTESESDESGSDEVGRSQSTCLHDNQLRMLLKAYQSTTRPSRAQRQALSNSTGLTQRDIQLWFRNKRRSEKQTNDQSEREPIQSNKVDCNTRSEFSNSNFLSHTQLPLQIPDVNMDHPHVPDYQVYCPLDYMVPGEMPPNIDLSSANICNGEIVMDKSRDIPTRPSTGLQNNYLNDAFRQWLAV